MDLPESSPRRRCTFARRKLHVEHAMFEASSTWQTRTGIFGCVCNVFFYKSLRSIGKLAHGERPFWHAGCIKGEVSSQRGDGLGRRRTHCERSAGDVEVGRSLVSDVERRHKFRSKDDGSCLGQFGTPLGPHKHPPRLCGPGVPFLFFRPAPPTCDSSRVGLFCSLTWARALQRPQERR